MRRTLASGGAWRPGFVVVVACTVAGLALLVPPPKTQPFVALYDEPADPAAATLVRGDGQFFAMLAQDPTLERPEVLRASEGEYAYRAARPGYGWLGWVASLGQARAVPWAMVALTVASAVLLAWSVAELARALGGRPEVGVLAVLLPGALVLLAWTGPELLAAALACLAARWCIEGREDRAMVALAGAVLLRETLALVVLALVLAGLLRWWRAALPALVLVGWNVVVALRVTPPSGSRYEPFGFLDADWGIANLVSLVLLVGLFIRAWSTWPRLAAALLAVHLPLALVTIPAVWSVANWTRVFLPVFALLLAMASGRGVVSGNTGGRERRGVHGEVRGSAIQ